MRIHRKGGAGSAGHELNSWKQGTCSTLIVTLGPLRSFTLLLKTYLFFSEHHFPSPLLRNEFSGFVDNSRRSGLQPDAGMCHIKLSTLEAADPASCLQTNLEYSFERPMLQKTAWLPPCQPLSIRILQYSAKRSSEQTRETTRVRKVRSK